MEALVYLVAILASLGCMVLLLRSYARTQVRLLLWTGLCFVALTLSNIFLFVDLMMVPHIDLYPWRLGSAFIGICILLYGFIWELD